MAVDIKEGDEFSNFEEFKVKLDDFMREKNVQFTLADSKTVESANKKAGKKAKLYKEDFKYRFAKFRCKHGGEKRTTGCGIRPGQR